MPAESFSWWGGLHARRVNSPGPRARSRRSDAKSHGWRLRAGGLQFVVIVLFLRPSVLDLLQRPVPCFPVASPPLRPLHDAQPSAARRRSPGRDRSRRAPGRGVGRVALSGPCGPHLAARRKRVGQPPLSPGRRSRGAPAATPRGRGSYPEGTAVAPAPGGGDRHADQRAGAKPAGFRRIPVAVERDPLARWRHRRAPPAGCLRGGAFRPVSAIAALGAGAPGRPAQPRARRRPRRSETIP